MYHFELVNIFIFFITNSGPLFVYSSPNGQVSVNVHFIPAIYNAQCRFGRIWNPPTILCASCFCMTGQHSRCIPRLFCNPNNLTSTDDNKSSSTLSPERNPESVITISNSNAQNIPIFLTTTERVSSPSFAMDSESITQTDPSTITSTVSTTTKSFESSETTPIISTSTPIETFTTETTTTETSTTETTTTETTTTETSTTETTLELTSSTRETEPTFTTSTEGSIMSSDGNLETDSSSDLVTTTEITTETTTELISEGDDNDSNDSMTTVSSRRRMPRPIRWK